MRTIGWVFILFAVWLLRAGLKGEILDDEGNFILGQSLSDTITALITGDTGALAELDAQQSGAGLIAPNAPIEPTVYNAATPAANGTGQGNVDAFAGTGKRAEVVAAAKSFAGDKYSQAKRWQHGFSDCSSFVGKALKKAGIKPPGISVVTSYRISKHWKLIGASQVQPGDIAYTFHHMVLMTGKGHGIGQQRPGVNVRSGSLRTLFGSDYPRFVRFKTFDGYPKPGAGGGGGGGSTRSW